MESNRKAQILFSKKIINPRNFTYGVILEILTKYLKNEKKVLDAGCGEGNISLFIASYRTDVIGVDISQKSIITCKKKANCLLLSKNTLFINADLEKQKFRERFDLITCIEAIEHINNDEMVLDKFFNWLKTDGTLFLSTPSKNAPLFKMGITKKRDDETGHLRRYSIKSLTEKLKKIGFIIIETKKTEGILRNFLFFTKTGCLPLRLANKFQFISDTITFLDNITLKLFGESQIIIVAQKPK